ncbi:L-alanine-DL-glutamate epimerase-like enolase superfamily enzyme [Rhizobium sp. SG_E_25_P2]|nr:L-alanine-DL-glutamate epimerase-like enolase superfamily enzyme [Rhizobium sp. SG_E_25_P2]
MAKIEKVELLMVDLAPKVKRTDAIQSFVSQETPVVIVTDSDGATGAGYSYTIGTGGSSVMRLLADHLAPRIIGQDADRIEAIWRDLEFYTHATTIGAITAIALAAIDTALWDLRARKMGCRSGNSPAALPIAGRSTPPKAAGCISTSRR